MSENGNGNGKWEPGWGAVVLVVGAGLLTAAVIMAAIGAL